MATEWWVVVPASEPDQNVMTGKQIISTTIGNAADNALAGGGSVTIAGHDYRRYLGPFGSKSQAQSAAPEGGLQLIGTYIGVAAGAAIEGFTQPGNSALPGAGGAAGGAAGQAISQNWQSWLIRAAEILLGIGLIIISLAKLVSDTPVGKAAIKAGKAAAIL